MNPYYEDESVTLYHGDCRELLPHLDDNCLDLVLTDPPYGVGKAEWDKQFPIFWMEDAARVAPTLGLMPGIWNLGKCPHVIGRLAYRWTLAAHLRNGQTRGALGLADWIPCMVYMADEAPQWCAAFADWCEANGVTRSRLDRIVGTSDMGGWWMSRLPHRCQVPTADAWAKIRAELDPPAELDAWVHASDPFRDSGSTSKAFLIGREPMAKHPSPKPLDITTWFMSRMPGYDLGRGVLDPFAGSGTTLVAAKLLGRKAIGVEAEERYCEVAAQRLSQGVLDFGEAG
ncbi:DNA methyltransferase [Kribbella sp. NPDC050470]|uniref:DNA methyltransferase n=1 Tax=unclassified Kribbella TaxID=2644121 RepID=UPI0037BB1CB6